MKKNTVILTVALILYLAICFTFKTDDFVSFSTIGKQDISTKGDYTNAFNEDFMKSYYSANSDVEYTSYIRKINLLYLFDLGKNYYYSSSKYDDIIAKDTSIYIFPLEQADEMIKKYNIKNPKNIDWSKTKYQFPFENEKSQSLLRDFLKEKNSPKIISTDKNGNPVYDSSPDSVILYTLKDEIQGFIYVDSRLADMRNLLSTPKLSNDALKSNSLLIVKILNNRFATKKSGNSVYLDWAPTETEY